MAHDPQSCPYCALNDLFAKIGILICNFANFEGYLAPALATMLGDNGDRASVILGQVDSFAYKWATVLGIAKTMQNHRCAEAIMSLEDVIKDAHAFRNQLAHGVTRGHGSELWLIANATSTKRGKVSSRRLMPEEVEHHMVRVKEAMDLLHDVIDWNSITSNEGLMIAFRHSTGPANPDPEWPQFQWSGSRPPKPPQSSQE